MCTLTFQKTEKGFIITNSRDEKMARQTIFPVVTSVQNRKVIFAKDQDFGGTWLLVSEESIVCLLNAKNNTEKENFSFSRGFLPELYWIHDADLISKTIENNEVAPFHLVKFIFGESFSVEEITWNGKDINIIKNSDSRSKIWSSTSLYHEEAQQLRKRWFEEIKDKNAENLLDFHFSKKSENNSINILMDDSNGKRTTSITQIILENNELHYQYFDILTQQNQKISWKKEMDLQLL